MERYGYTPKEWDQIDKTTRLEMIEKRNLEIEMENRQIEEAKNGD